MPKPTETPIGLALARAAKAVERAFDAALAEAGGSRPVWLVLIALKTARPPTQGELAAAVGIREATLSHHLAAMEEAGFVERTRNAGNRRIQTVAITAAGDAELVRLASAARAHDARLRRGLSDAQVSALRRGLEALQANVG